MNLCKSIEIRKPRERYRTPFSNFGPSMTDQTKALETDINYIVARYARSGEFPPLLQQPVFADVTQLQGELSERLAYAERIIGEAKALQEAAKAAAAKPADVPVTPVESQAT